MTEHNPSELNRGAGTILACLLGIAFGVSPFGTLYSLSSFVRPLIAEFGWTNSQIQMIPTVCAASIIPVGFIVGWMADRMDVRQLILVSQIGVGLILFALGALTTNLTIFYALYFIMPIFGGGTLLVTFNKLLSRSFSERRGLAIGIALVGSGVAGIVAPTYASILIAHFGWRRAYEGLALLPLCVALPATLIFMRPQRPAGVSSADTPTVALEGVTLGVAIRTWQYSAICIAIVLCGGASAGLISNMVPLFIDEGYGATEAAAVASFFGLSVIVGRVLVGWALDRFWGPAVATALFLPNAISLLLLAQGRMDHTWLLIAVVPIGIATGAELDLAGYLCSRYFGVRHIATVYSGVFVMLPVGSAFGSRGFGYAHDAYGSYGFALIGSAVAMLAAAGVLLTIGPYRYATTRPAWALAPAGRGTGRSTA